jgi:hypothetical protein
VLLPQAECIRSLHAWAGATSLGHEQLELLTGVAKSTLAVHVGAPELAGSFPLAARSCQRALALLAAALQQLAGSSSLPAEAVMHCRGLCRTLKEAFLPGAG